MEFAARPIHPQKHRGEHFSQSGPHSQLGDGIIHDDLAIRFAHLLEHGFRSIAIGAVRQRVEDGDVEFVEPLRERLLGLAERDVGVKYILIIRLYIRIATMV
jgi:hypothetical protein